MVRKDVKAASFHKITENMRRVALASHSGAESISSFCSPLYIMLVFGMLKEMKRPHNGGASRDKMTIKVLQT